MPSVSGTHIIFAFIFFAALSFHLSAEPAFEKTEIFSNDGYYVLSWDKAPDEIIELEEAASPDFHPASGIYRGKDRASAMSGKKNGTYYYRIRTAGSVNWSETCTVRVEHHSLLKAILFMGSGAAVFFATLLLLFYEGFVKKSNNGENSFE